MNKIYHKILSIIMLMIFGNISAQHQELYEYKTFTSNTGTLNYRILYPKYFSKDKQYPLVIFLHGAGERGNDNATQLAHGSKLFADETNRTQFPAVVIFPQCPQDDYWANVSVDRAAMPLKLTFQDGGKPTKALSLLMQLLDNMLTKSYINNNQVYLGGLSMGGMGTFELLSRKPNTFAAAFAICGGGSTQLTKNYATTIDLWIFHGAKDDVVIPQHSIDMVTAILNNGGKPNFTLYADDNHNSWDSTFAEPKLLPWLFSKSKN